MHVFAASFHAINSISASTHSFANELTKIDSLLLRAKWQVNTKNLGRRKSLAQNLTTE